MTISKHLNIAIGKTVERPVFMEGGYEIMVGTVTYIHPEGRFYTVRFEAEGGIIEESYCFYGKLSGGRKAVCREDKEVA